MCGYDYTKKWILKDRWESADWISLAQDRD
jgi:hypothetical protein